MMIQKTLKVIFLQFTLSDKQGHVNEEDEYAVPGREQLSKVDTHLAVDIFQP